METKSATMPRNYRNVLAAFDGSAGSTRALRRAIELAELYDAQVIVFSVDENIPRYAPGVGKVAEEDSIREERFSQLREAALVVVGEAGSRVKMETEVGHAAQSIIRRVEEGHFDLVVIGHSGHSGLWGTMLGSTTARVVDQSSCDVLVVR